MAQKVNEGGSGRIELKMKEFEENFVESTLEGVKVKVKSKYDNGVYALFKYIFLEINSLFREKKRKSLSFFFFRYLIYF